MTRDRRILRALGVAAALSCVLHYFGSGPYLALYVFGAYLNVIVLAGAGLYVGAWRRRRKAQQSVAP